MDLSQEILLKNPCLVNEQIDICNLPYRVAPVAALNLDNCRELHIIRERDEA